MKLGAHGKWETKRTGEGQRRRGKGSGVKSQSQGVRDGGEGGGREGGRGDRGKVWKLADRTGYAQTESQVQAQT